MTTEPWAEASSRGAAAPADVLLALWDSRSAIARLPKQGCLVVGRGKGSGLFIDNPWVSTAHARVEVIGPLVTIVDLGSKNGVRVNGRLLAKGEVASVGSDERVHLGPVMLQVQRQCAFDPQPLPRDAIWGSVPGILIPRAGPMVQVQRLIEHIAPKEVNVVILGETGTGKEVAARAVHRFSKRGARPFMAINCGGLPESLLDSELFGHEKGAFTGALTAKAGLLELAHGGILFMDEIGEMPIATQIKLLRVLQDRVVRRLGATSGRPIDVRVVSATHRDLPGMVMSGAFRRDLYHRLRGVTVVLPPLRERTAEIMPLARSFVRDQCALDGVPEMPIAEAAARALEAHAWPGNIRELSHVMRGAASRSMTGRIDVADLELHDEVRTTLVDLPPVRPSMGHTASLPVEGGEVMGEGERRIAEKIAECGGNHSRSARELGISRKAVAAMADRLGLARPRKRVGAVPG